MFPADTHARTLRVVAQAAVAAVLLRRREPLPNRGLVVPLMFVRDPVLMDTMRQALALPRLVLDASAPDDALCVRSNALPVTSRNDMVAAITGAGFAWRTAPYDRADDAKRYAWIARQSQNEDWLLPDDVYNTPDTVKDMAALARMVPLYHSEDVQYFRNTAAIHAALASVRADARPAVRMARERLPFV